MNGKLRHLLWAGTTVVIGAMIWSGYIPRLGAQQQDQQNQSDQQKSSDQQNQDQSQSDQGQKKKKGGIFGGMKAVTTQSSDQSKATATMGTKGALDGKAIADLTPTAADRQAVTDMESLSIPQGDVKKFGEDGHLQPK